MDTARRIIDRAPQWDHWDLVFSRFADQTAPDPTAQLFAHFLPWFGDKAENSVH